MSPNQPDKVICLLFTIEYNIYKSLHYNQVKHNECLLNLSLKLHVFQNKFENYFDIDMEKTKTYN